MTKSGGRMARSARQSVTRTRGGGSVMCVSTPTKKKDEPHSIPGAWLVLVAPLLPLHHKYFLVSGRCKITNFSNTRGQTEKKFLWAN